LQAALVAVLPPMRIAHRNGAALVDAHGGTSLTGGFGGGFAAAIVTEYSSRAKSTRPATRPKPHEESLSELDDLRFAFVQPRMCLRDRPKVRRKRLSYSMRPISSLPFSPGSCPSSAARKASRSKTACSSIATYEPRTNRDQRAKPAATRTEDQGHAECVNAHHGKPRASRRFCPSTI